MLLIVKHDSNQLHLNRQTRSPSSVSSDLIPNCRILIQLLYLIDNMYHDHIILMNYVAILNRGENKDLFHSTTIQI